MDDIAQRYKGHRMNSYQILLHPIARKKDARFFSKMNTSTLGGQSLIICFRGQIDASIYIYRDT